MRFAASPLVGRALSLCLATFAFSLSACASFSPGGAGSDLDTAVAGVPAAGAATSVTDAYSPVLAFVGEASPQEQAQLNDPGFGGVVSVILEAEYHSASDKRCRRFRVLSAAAPPEGRSHFACYANGRWALVDLNAL